MTDLSGTQTYQYDPLYRLTQAAYPGPQTDTYTYDAVGNRQTKNATTYTYDDADRMLSAGGVAYGYDNNGNQTSRGSDTFGYDHENRLTQAVIGGVTSSSTYNGDGLRISHTVNGTMTSYTWDVNRRVPEILQDGTNTYVYGLGRISSTDANGSQTYFLSDALGSTTNLADGTGNVQASYSYDVFGAVRSQTGTSSNYWQFTGEQRDADSGAYYLRARYYDPAIGRFLAQDPLPTANRYSYVGNNPVNWVDPHGLFGIPGTGIDVDVPDPSDIIDTAVDVVGSNISTAITCAAVPVVLAALSACGISLFVNPNTTDYALNGVQVADLFPWANIPIAGQIIGETFDIGAFLALQYQILTSDCPWEPLTLANATNLAVGTLGNLGGPFTVNQTSAIEAVNFGATAAYLESCGSVSYANGGSKE